MTELLSPLAAVTLAAIIFTRAVCVCYSTSPAKHAHPILFFGFGYSYVLLGAGAIFAAVDILGVEVGDIPLWCMMVGSAGLIAFDRRRAACWHVTQCPVDGEAQR